MTEVQLQLTLQGTKYYKDPGRSLRLPAEDLRSLGTHTCHPGGSEGYVVSFPAIAKERIDFLLRQDEEFIDEGQRLSERQREVLQLLTEGKSMKQVAHTLNVSKETVAFHKYRIREILNAKNDAKLVQYAVRSHIIAA